MSDLRFIQSSFTGDGVFRDKKADFETTYILKKADEKPLSCRRLYRCRQVGKGDEEIGVLVSNEQEKRFISRASLRFPALRAISRSATANI